MTDKVQLIKEEIERLYKHYLDAQEFDSGYNMALDDMLKFIDSLPKESVNKDLEEYYKKEFLPKEWFAKPGHRTISQFNFFTAQHFAEWQKQKSMQDLLEKACEWLEDTQLENFICHDDGIYFENEKFVEQFKNYMQDESEN